MNVRKYLLSCAAIAISGGVLSFAVQNANAQPADDFFAPPVVENVTEIELPDVDAPGAIDAMQDISVPEFPVDDIANTSPENLGEFLPDVGGDAMAEPEVVSEDLPAFPEVEGVGEGEGVAETSIPAPAISPSRRALWSAASFTMPPRAVLISTAPGWSWLNRS